MKPRQIVRQGRGRTSKPKLQATDLNHASLDLSRQTYLSVVQLVQYLQLRSRWHAYKWLERHPTVRRVRDGRDLRIWRKDVDAALEQQAVQQMAS